MIARQREPDTQCRTPSCVQTTLLNGYRIGREREVVCRERIHREQCGLRNAHGIQPRDADLERAARLIGDPHTEGLGRRAHAEGTAENRNGQEVFGQKSQPSRADSCT